MKKPHQGATGNLVPFLSVLLIFLIGCDNTNSDWNSFVQTEKNISFDIGDTVLNEGGEAVELSLVLTAEPDNFVDVFFENPDGQIEVGPVNNFRVHPVDWQDTLKVHVAAKADHLEEEGSHPGLLSVFSESTDSDYNLDLTGTRPIIFNILDDDVAGLDLSIVPLIVQELDGESGSLSLNLLSQPTFDVAVSVSLEISDAFFSFAPQPPTLIFSRDNWYRAQTFIVNATEDNVHGNHRTNSFVFFLESDDVNYESLVVEPVEFEIIDFSPEPRISFNQNSINNLIEGADVAFDFLVVLEGSSVEEVLFAIHSVPSPNSPEPGSDFVALPDTLVFAPDETEVTVSMEIVNDIDAEPDEIGIFYIEALENGWVEGNTAQVIVVFTDDD